MIESPKAPNVLLWIGSILIAIILSLIGAWAAQANTNIASNSKDIVTVREHQAARDAMIDERLKHIEERLEYLIRKE